MELLEELGYRFNKEALKHEFEEMGRGLTSGTYNWFIAAAPYIAMAHKRGVEGKSLSGVFPFLEVLDG